MATKYELYEQALSILDVLSIKEEDFITASRLNAVIVELCVLQRRHAARSEWLAALARSATGAPSFVGKV